MDIALIKTQVNYVKNKIINARTVEELQWYKNLLKIMKNNFYYWARNNEKYSKERLKELDSIDWG